MPNKYLTTIATIFPGICLVYNMILLVATVVNRKNHTLPLAYIIVMSINGSIISFCVSLHFSIYLFLSEEDYHVYLVKYGRETTLIGTFVYLNYLMVSVLMTINRVVVVAKPFNDTFKTSRVFIYVLIIATATFISLLIPYLSPCYIVFDASKLSFVSGCAPGRHPITLFQNTYAITIPVGCMFVNLGIIVHLKFTRKGFYKKTWLCLTGKKPTSSETQGDTLQSTSMSNIQERRDIIMMRQTINVAVYLSIYEFGALVAKLLPNFYASWPQDAREGYFLFRMASIPAMNFIIYYAETANTRRMFRKFLRCKTGAVDSAFNATGVAPAPIKSGTASDARSRMSMPVN